MRTARITFTEIDTLGPSAWVDETEQPSDEGGLDTEVSLQFPGR